LTERKKTVIAITVAIFPIIITAFALVHNHPARPVRDLRSPSHELDRWIADVEDAQATVLKTASEHLGVLGIVGDTGFSAVAGRPRNGRQIVPRRRSGDIRRRLGSAAQATSMICG